MASKGAISKVVDCTIKVFFIFFWFDLILYQQSFSYVGTDLLRLNQSRINVSCSRTQHTDAGEAQARGPSVSSQALYH